MKLETWTIYGGFTGIAGAEFPSATFTPPTPIVSTVEPGIDFPISYLLHGFTFSTSVRGEIVSQITPLGPIGCALVLGQHQDQVQIGGSSRVLACQFRECASGTLGKIVQFFYSLSRYCPLQNGPVPVGPTKSVRLYFFSPPLGSVGPPIVPGIRSAAAVSTATLYLERYE